MTAVVEIFSPLAAATRIAALARDAYQRARLEPRGGRYTRMGDGRLRCACAVGALHLAFAIGDETREQTFHRLTGAGQRERRDFELGFDSAFKHAGIGGRELYDDTFLASQSAWWRVGRAVGLAVRPRMTSPKEHT